MSVLWFYFMVSKQNNSFYLKGKGKNFILLLLYKSKFDRLCNFLDSKLCNYIGSVFCNGLILNRVHVTRISEFISISWYIIDQEHVQCCSIYDNLRQVRSTEISRIDLDIRFGGHIQWDNFFCFHVF